MLRNWNRAANLQVPSPDRLGLPAGPLQRRGRRSRRTHTRDDKSLLLEHVDVDWPGWLYLRCAAGTLFVLRAISGDCVHAAFTGMSQ